jgi:hypothetical protein
MRRPLARAVRPASYAASWISKRVTLRLESGTRVQRLVLQPGRLALKRLAFEIVDGLPNLCDDRVVSSPMEAPWSTGGSSTRARPRDRERGAIDAVGPSDIVGKHGHHAIDIPRVEAVTDVKRS